MFLLNNFACVTYTLRILFLSKSSVINQPCKISCHNNPDVLKLISIWIYKFKDFFRQKVSFLNYFKCPRNLKYHQKYEVFGNKSDERCANLQKLSDF